MAYRSNRVAHFATIYAYDTTREIHMDATNSVSLLLIAQSLQIRHSCHLLSKCFYSAPPVCYPNGVIHSSSVLHLVVTITPCVWHSAPSPLGIEIENDWKFLCVTSKCSHAGSRLFIVIRVSSQTAGTILGIVRVPNRYG